MNPQAPRASQPGVDTGRGPGISEWLSALADGEVQADPDAAPRATQAWRDDPEARRAWHAWHLIGDVLRSEHLASPPARDAAFLAALRERLAAEPVVLAPAATPVLPARWRSAWLAPAAVAAGFVAVAGVLVVARIGLPDLGPAGAAAVLASASSPGLTLASVPAAPSSGQGGAALIRDARLDSYLRAHQSARGNLAAAVPGGGMRNVEAVTIVGPER
jgi:sigma-E factor negative regulatory protein RseA